MSYKNAMELLPAHLIKEVQKYIDGGLVYIPKKNRKVGWGHLSGARKSIDARNEKIFKLYRQGFSIKKLSQEFYLSEETIRKIIYGKK